MRIEIRKFGKLLMSRPDGREAFLAMRAYSIPRDYRGTIELDFSGVDVLTPSWLDEIVTGLRSELKLEVHFLRSDNLTVMESIKAIGPPPSQPVHPWRVNICAGVRWLSHKRDLLSDRLGHQASWLETISKFKGTTKVTKAREKNLIDRFKKK